MEMQLSYPLQESTRLLVERTALDVARTVDQLQIHNPTDAHLAALKSLQSLETMFAGILLANELALHVAFCVENSSKEPRNTVSFITTEAIDNGKEA